MWDWKFLTEGWRSRFGSQLLKDDYLKILRLDKIARAKHRQRVGVVFRTSNGHCGRQHPGMFQPWVMA